MNLKPAIKEALKKCKSRTALMTPCIVYRVNEADRFQRVYPPVGKGYIIYDSLTMNVLYDLVDADGNELPMEFYSLEQLQDASVLIHYSKSVN